MRLSCVKMTPIRSPKPGEIDSARGLGKFSKANSLQMFPILLVARQLPRNKFLASRFQSEKAFIDVNGMVAWWL